MGRSARFAACLAAACLAAACGGTPAADDIDLPDAKVGQVDAAIDAPPPKVVRFAAIGDTGKGNTDQRAVAVAMRDVCAARGCDFVLMLGDNIYDSGVDSTSSPEWQTKFEQPYADIDLPFYAVLGNHDYGGNIFGIEAGGVGNEWNLGQIEVDYTQVSTKWKMPATHYTLKRGHVGFLMLDTNAIMWGNTTYGDQAAWLPTAMQELAGSEWIFVAGHHPYRSNGEHGNAGNYDAPELLGIPIPNPIPQLNGSEVKAFFDDHLAGVGQVYFAGHDHSRQWLDEADMLGGTELIVNGAGATVTSLRDRGNQVFWQDATIPGFLYVTVVDDRFTGEFFDKAGVSQYTRSFTHP